MGPTPRWPGGSGWSASGCTPYGSASCTPAGVSTSSTSRPTPWTWRALSRSSAMPTDATAAQPNELRLRPALGSDLDAVHDVFVAAVATPGHPPETRAPDEVRDWIDSLLDTPGELWLASRNDELLGFFLLRGSWLSLLFVHPDRPARGVSVALLDLVKALRRQGFGLR